MGAGKKKTHEAYGVAPTILPASGGVGLMTGEAPHSDAYDQAQLLIDQVCQSVPDLDTDVGEQYHTLCQQAEEARALLKQAEAEGMPGQLIAEAGNELKAGTQNWLQALPEEQLQALAAEAGFEHPSLVGLNTKPGQPPALAHWLDPAYPTDLASKANIQAKALQRYDELLAGGTVGGMTLGDVKAKEAALGVTALDTTAWVATPAELDELQAHLDDLVSQGKAIKYQHDPGTAPEKHAALLSEAIGTENRIFDASCPGLSPDDLGGRKANAAAALNAGFHPQNSYGAYNGVGALVTYNPDGLDVGHARLLSSQEALAVLRHSTPPGLVAALEAKAAEHQAILDQMKELAPTYGPPIKGLHSYASHNPSLALSDLTSVDGKAQAAAFVDAAGKWTPVTKGVNAWWGQAAAGGGALAEEVGVGSAYEAGPYPGTVTTSFRAWAKQQPLGEVKALAGDLGLPAQEMQGATRAQVQNWIASKWDPAVPTPDFSAPKASKSLKPPTPTKLASVAGAGINVPTPSFTPAPVVPPPSGFSAKKAALKDKLAHYAASVSALPPRQPQSKVEAMALTPGKAMSVGGAHAKSFYNGPGQTTWMFKPDKTNQGARAHAEAAASEIMHQTGIPSVPVYTRTIKGKKGSVQPFLEHSNQIDSSPSSWSQPDVDAMVRYHVAAWATGDHDGKADNMLRTPGGGLVPIDQGQAFKFFGSDRLESSYHPNSSFGVAPPVFHQAYMAHKGGGLAKGVRVRPEAALPVISAFEAVPDSQYRAILRNTAHEGAKHKVGWYSAMRSRAAKKHGVLSPSDSQVAEAFLDTACERKHRLRADFANFFAREGLSNEALAAQMG